MAKPIVGVMGPGEDAGETDRDLARKLGKEIARKGWVLLTGGRNAGVMDAASEGAHEAGGLTLGILPGKDRSGASSHLDVAVLTGMGEARNVINVQTADAVIAVGMNPGTASEVALAVKAGKDVILLGCPEAGRAFFSALGGGKVRSAASVEEALLLLNDSSGLTKS